MTAVVNTNTRRNSRIHNAGNHIQCDCTRNFRRPAMGRNSELIRQWTLLQQLAAVRTNTIPQLAVDLKVSTRTVRRDLEALQLSGFPIYDETVDGTKFWRMDPKPAGAMAMSGLTFSELCALYFS